MTATLPFILPALVLSGFSILLFGVDAYENGVAPKRTRLGFMLTLLGLVGAAALLFQVDYSAAVTYGRGMLIADGLSYALSWIAILSTAIVVVLSEEDAPLGKTPLAVYYGMLLLSATGLLLAVSANDFLMIFLAIEMVGIPAFILTGYQRKSAKSGEAALKFFLIGAFSSAMLAYGVSLLYGLTGSTSLPVLLQSLPLLEAKTPIAMLAIFFVVVSFGFKIALVPFHMWVPDAFEGAPVPIAAYLSVAPKLAGAALAIRVFTMALPPGSMGVTFILAILSGLTMTIANVIGLQQTNVIRLLAYSSISHMGYLLLGIVAGSPDGIASVYLYGVIYLFMNLGVFALVVMLNNACGSSELSAYSGLSKRAPALSALFVVFMISLAGLPPTAGFVAKFYVFTAAYEAGWLWLLVLAAINSVISIGYYFKILHAMYFKNPESAEPITVTTGIRVVLAVTSFATLFLGLAPNIGLSQVKKFVTPPAPPVAAEPDAEVPVP